MKPFFICIAFSLLVGLAGCHREHDKLGDAPRTETTAPTLGGKQVSTSGVTLSFPDGWKFIDLSTDSFEKGADQVFGSDPKFAALRTQASAAAKQGMFKLIAFETATAGTGFATNCNVVVQDTHGQGTLEQISDATVSQITPVVAPGTTPKLQYVNLKSGKTAFIRSEIKGSNPAIPTLLSLAYLSLKDNKLAVITFTAPTKDETHIQSIADQVMDTFHFGE